MPTNAPRARVHNNNKNTMMEYNFNITDSNYISMIAFKLYEGVWCTYQIILRQAISVTFSYNNQA